MRSIDKLDRLGNEGVFELLTTGRKAAFRRRLLAKDEGAPIAAAKLTRKGHRALPCGRLSGWRKLLGSWNAVRREHRLR